MPVDGQTRQRRLFKNGIYGLLSWLFPLIPTFVVTPILVKSLGNEMYGLYMVIVGFITYFFTFGIGKAAAKYVAEYRSTGETEKISDIISSTIVLSFALGLVGTTVIALVARPVVSDVLLISPQLQETAVLAIYLACATILVLVLSNIFQLILQGLQRFDRFLMLSNLNSILLSTGSIALVLNGFGVPALLVWTLIVAAGMGVLSFITATRLMPEFAFSLTIKREAWQAVWRYAASIIAYQVFGNLLLLFERGWIMRKFGPEALTYYVVPMTLGLYIHLFISSLVVAIFPMVNELLSQTEKLQVLYKKSTKIILFLIVFAVVSAIVGGRTFLSLWMDDEFALQSYPLLVIHVTTFALLAVVTIAWQVAESFRFAAINAIATFSWMLISIPLMVFLGAELQSKGVAYGRLAGVLVFIPLLFYVEKRFLGGVFWNFWGGLAIRLVPAALLTAAAEFLILRWFEVSWLTFFSAVAVGGLIYCASLVVSGFVEASDREILRQALVKSK